MLKPLHIRIAEWRGLSGPHPNPSREELLRAIEDYVGDRDGEMSAADAALFDLLQEAIHSPSAAIIAAGISDHERALCRLLKAKGYEAKAFIYRESTGRWTVGIKVTNASPFQGFRERVAYNYTFDDNLGAAIDAMRKEIASVEDVKAMAATLGIEEVEPGLWREVA